MTFDIDTAFRGVGEELQHVLAEHGKELLGGPPWCYLKSPNTVTACDDRIEYDFKPLKTLTSGTAVSNIKHRGERVDLETGLIGEEDHALHRPVELRSLANTFDTHFPDVAADIRYVASDVEETITKAPQIATTGDVIEAVNRNNSTTLELIFQPEHTISEEIERQSELGRLAESTVEFTPFKDSKYALLYPEDPELKNKHEHRRRSIPPDEGYIVGIDDTSEQWFVHSINVDDLKPTADVSKQDIREALGYKQRLDPDVDVFDADEEKRETARIHGDLVMEATTGTKLYDDRVVPDNHERASEKILTRELSAFLDILYPNIGDWYVDVERWFNPDDPDINWEVHASNNDSVESRQPVVHFRKHVREYADSIAKDIYSVQQEIVEDAVEEKQLNLVIGNHLIIIADAAIHPERSFTDELPIRVVVPEQTAMYVIHDEHGTVNIQLTRGVYRFGLLRRGAKQRTQWWHVNS